MFLPLNLDGCGFSNSSLDAAAIVWQITYSHYGILALYLTVGQVDNVLLTIAMFMQAKLDGVYVYQLAIVLSKTIQCFLQGLTTAGGYWFGGNGGTPSVSWYVSQYWILHVNARILYTIFQTSVLVTLGFTVAASIDRALAMIAPIAYRKWNHRLRQKIATAVTISLAASLGIDYYWVYVIVPQDDHYAIANNPYVGTPLAVALEIVKTAVRVIATVVLIVANATIIITYRKRTKTIANMTSEEQMKIERQANRDLAILTICQSILTCFDQIPNSVMQVIRKQSQFAAKCGLIMTPFASGSSFASIIAEFFIIIAVNRKIRGNVKKILSRCKCCKGNNQVVPLIS